jgi:antitoxin component YwqK of YwqJK toxin-antitoxin module
MATRAKVTKHIQHHKNGSIWGKGTVKDGQMHGYWEWFRKNGTKMRSGYFDLGQQVGEWITYDRKGKPYRTTVIDE